MKEYKRNCPECDIELTYTSRSGYYSAKRKKSNCKKCSSRIAAEKSGFTARYATKGKNTGKDNPFYGKTHTDETKEKLSKTDRSYTQTKEFREKISTLVKGEKNPFYGKKHTKETRKKISKNLKGKAAGSKNPMYGKPSPKGSGVGWKGWYKNIYFRSLRELAFMIEMDINNIKYTTAEHIKIKYKDYFDNERTYRPDFIIENKTVVEIKPKRLIKTKLVLLKTLAAVKYCKENNLIFKIKDCEIDLQKILDRKKDIKFNGKYEERFKSYVSAQGFTIEW